MNSIPKVLIFFFKQHVLRIFLHDYYNILYNLLIQVRERKTTFSTSNDRILLYFAGTRRRKRRREDCNRRCRATKRFRLQSWSTCRYCRKSSIFYATWYVNIPFILNTRSCGTSVSFRLSCKNRFGKLCVEFDRYSSTEGGVHAWVWRSKEGRNGGIEPGGYVNQASQHAGCCVIKDSSPIVRTSNSPNFNFILEFIQSLL